MDIFNSIVTANYVKLAIPFFLLFIGLELIVCKLKKKPFYRLNDAIGSLSCGIFQQIIKIISRGFFLLPYIFVYKNFALINFYSLGLGLCIASAMVLFVAVDFAYYWFHRLAHECNLGWAVHIVHHQSEEYNLTTALRQGMFQNAFSFIFYLPLAVIGFPPLWFFGISSFNTTYQFWIHTRLIKKMPTWVEIIFNTPSHHRVHHGQNPQYIDRNYAGIFIIWDKMFSTFQAEGEEPRYGLTKPLASFNPLWAQIHYLVTLVKQSLHGPFGIDTLRIWWKPPGWEQPGLQVDEDNCDKERKYFSVYNPKISSKERAMGFLIFVIAIAASVPLLLFKSVFSYHTALFVSAFIMIALVVCGLVFNCKFIRSRADAFSSRPRMSEDK